MSRTKKGTRKSGGDAKLATTAGEPERLPDRAAEVERLPRPAAEAEQSSAPTVRAEMTEPQRLAGLASFLSDSNDPVARVIHP
jgi:hypothetical protein